MPSVETMTKPYPIPLPTLPALMLAASIHSIKYKSLRVGTEKILRTEGWKATFLARSRLGTARKVNNKVISKAQFKRLLKKLLALYKRDLPLLLIKYLNLKEHLIGYLFK